MVVVHFVQAQRDFGIVRFMAACGIPNVVEHWWTINKALFTCEECKAKLNETV